MCRSQALTGLLLKLSGGHANSLLEGTTCESSNVPRPAAITREQTAPPRNQPCPHPSVHLLTRTWLVFTYPQLGTPTLPKEPQQAVGRAEERLRSWRVVGSVPSVGSETAPVFHLRMVRVEVGRSRRRGMNRGSYGSGSQAAMLQSGPHFTKRYFGAVTKQSIRHSSSQNRFVCRVSDAKGRGKLRPKAVGSRQALACAPGGDVASGNHSPGPPERGGKRSQARRRHLGALSVAKVGQAGKGRKEKRGSGLLFGTHALTQSSAGVSTRTSWMRLGEGLGGQRSREGVRSNGVCLCSSDPGGWGQMDVYAAPSREM